MKMMLFIISVICFMLCGLPFCTDSHAAEIGQEYDSGASAAVDAVRTKKARAAVSSRYGANAAGKNAVSGRNVQGKSVRHGNSAAGTRNAANTDNAASSAAAQQNGAAKGNYQRRKAYSRKKTASSADEEIDQLPLPPPPSKDSSLSSEENADENLSENADSYEESQYPSKKKNFFSQSQANGVADLSQLEMTYSKPAGWDSATRVKGATFAMQKNHAIFIVNETKEVCTPETVLQSSRKGLGQYKDRDKPSKLKAYAVKDGVSGHYFYIDNMSARNYYMFLCAGEKTLEITLTNADEKLFDEAMSSLKMEESGKKTNKNQRPKLQPAHYSTEDVGSVIK